MSALVRLSRVLAFTALLSALGANEALAEPVDDATRNAARTLGTAGVKAYLQGDYSVAKEQLERSFYLFPIATLGLWSARALAKRGFWVEAAARYRQVPSLPVEAGDADIQRAAQTSAESELAELLPRIPVLTASVVGARLEDVAMTIDGTILTTAQVLEGVSLNAGQHEMVAQYGQRRLSNSVTLVARQRELVAFDFSVPEPVSPASVGAPLAVSPASVSAPLEVPGVPARLQPSPASPPDSARDARQLSRTGGWLGLGVGAVGLGTGLVTYLVARDQHADITKDPRCSGDSCQPEARAKVDTYNTMRTVSVASWVAGGVFSAVGVTLLWLSQSPSRELKLTAEGSSLALSGTF